MGSSFRIIGDTIPEPRTKRKAILLVCVFVVGIFYGTEPPSRKVIFTTEGGPANNVKVIEVFDPAEDIDGIGGRPYLGTESSGIAERSYLTVFARRRTLESAVTRFSRQQWSENWAVAVEYFWRTLHRQMTFREERLAIAFVDFGRSASNVRDVKLAAHWHPTTNSGLLTCVAGEWFTYRDIAYDQTWTLDEQQSPIGDRGLFAKGIPLILCDDRGDCRCDSGGASSTKTAIGIWFAWLAAICSLIVGAYLIGACLWNVQCCGRYRGGFGFGLLGIILLCLGIRHLAFGTSWIW